MKTLNILKIIAVAGLALSSTQSHAVEILLEAPVGITINGDANESNTSLLAYRDSSDCSTWYWLPPGFMNLPRYSTEHSVVPVPIEGMFSEARKQVRGATSNYKFTVKGIAPLASELTDLRKAIVIAIQNRINQDRANAIPAANSRYLNCESYTENRINLIPLVSNAVTPVAKVDKKIEGVSSAAASPSLGGNFDPGTGVSFNPMNPFKFSLTVDAIHDNVEPKLSEDIQLPTPTAVAHLTFPATALLNQMTATISVTGKISATWMSELKNTVNCHKDDKNLLGGGFLGSAGGAFGLNYSSTKCDYNQEWVKSLKGCDDDSDKNCGIRDTLVFRYHMKSQGMENAFVTICPNDKCGENTADVPYKEWVRTQLLAMWLQQNFDLDLKAGKDNILNPKGYPNGTIEFDVATAAQFSEDKPIKVQFASPVIVKNIRAKDISPTLKAPGKFVSCGQEYRDYAIDQFNPNNTQLTPIWPACFKAPPSL